MTHLEQRGPLRRVSVKPAPKSDRKQRSVRGNQMNLKLRARGNSWREKLCLLIRPRRNETLSLRLLRLRNVLKNKTVKWMTRRIKL